MKRERRLGGVSRTVVWRASAACYLLLSGDITARGVFAAWQCYDDADKNDDYTMR